MSASAHARASQKYKSRLSSVRGGYEPRICTPMSGAERAMSIHAFSCLLDRVSLVRAGCLLGGWIALKQDKHDASRLDSVLLRWALYDWLNKEEKKECWCSRGAEGRVACVHVGSLKQASKQAGTADVRCLKRFEFRSPQREFQFKLSIFITLYLLYILLKIKIFLIATLDNNTINYSPLQ